MNVSIITVCYNAEKTIDKTIRSIIDQSYIDFEYIIIDGKSSDQTLEIIQSYQNAFIDKGIPFTYISESDSGIYNAMNKGIDLAKGKWCIFINADDSLYNNKVLENVFLNCSYDGIDAVYGGYCRCDEKNRYVFQSETIEILPRKMPFIHQSIFVRTDIYKQFKFDETYKLCADYDLFFKMFVNGYQFKQISTIITTFSIDGASGNNNEQALYETIAIRNKHIEHFPITSEMKRKWKRQVIVMRIKKKIPNNFLIQLRKIKAFVRIKLLHRTTC